MFGSRPPESSRNRLRLSRFAKNRTPLITVTATILILSLVAISPDLLKPWERLKGINWTQLGNIGQTYGGASAILGGVALIGISASLIIQVRQDRTERVRAVRERHMELLRIVLDNPRIYAPVVGPNRHRTADEIRQHLFTTMWMNYSLTGYEMGILPERTVREEIMRSSFEGKPARTWWSAAQPHWVEGGITRKERQFTRMIDEEYRKAAASGDPLPFQELADSTSDKTTSTKISRWSVPASVAAGICIGILLRWRRRTPTD